MSKKTVEERVVKMEFDNSNFESNVKTSMNTLEKLKNSLKLDGATTNLKGLNEASKKLDLSNISAGVQNLESRFSSLGIVGKRVLENLTDEAMGFVKNGLDVVSDAVIGGGKRRAFNIENAHFQLQGLLKDEKAVQAVMDDAMQSVDGTAYAYDEAAKAASQFAASGMKAGTEMQSALRAITGVAAMTNSEYEGISRIFTTVAGNGRLMGDQLLQLSSRGMNAAAAITDYVNKVKSGSVEASDEVKAACNEISDGMSITEAELRDAVSDSKVSFKLFAAAMDDAFGEHAKKANETFTGAMSNVRAALARIGAEFVSPLIVQNGPMVQMFNALRERINDVKSEIGPLATAFTDAVNNMASSAADFLQKVEIKDTVKNIAEAGASFIKSIDFKSVVKGFVNILASIKNVATGIISIIKPIKAAFDDIFPSETSNRILDITEKIKNLTAKSKLNEKQSESLKNVFKGLFSVLKVGIDALKTIMGLIRPMGPAIGKILGAVLDLAGGLGKLITGFNKTKSSGEEVSRAFSKIGVIFETTADKISYTIGTVIDAFKRFGQTKLKMPDFPSMESFIESFRNVKTQVIDKITGIFESFKNIKFELPKFNGTESISNFFSALVSAVKGKLSELKDALSNSKGAIGEFFHNLAEGIKAGTEPIKSLVSGTLDIIKALVEGVKDILSTISLKTIIDAMELGLAIKAFTKIQKWMKSFKKSTTSFKSAIIGVISEVSNTLKAFQKNLKAESIKTLAESVAILAGALVALSLVPGESLIKAGIALSVVMGELGTLTIIVGKFSKGANGITSLKDISAPIMGMAGALLVIAMAFKKLAALKWDDVKKGMAVLAEFGGVVATVVGVFSFIQGKLKFATDMSGIAGTILAFGVSMSLVIKSLSGLKNVSAENITVALVGLGALLTGLGLLLKQVSSSALAPITSGSATGTILAFGVSLNMMAKAIATLAKVDPVGLLRGWGTLEILMYTLAGFVSAIKGPQGAGAAVTIVALALAMNMLVPPITALGLLPFPTLAQGLGAVIGALFGFVGIGKIAAGAAEGLLILDASLLAIGGTIWMIGSGIKLLGDGISFIAKAAETFKSVGGNNFISMFETMALGIGKLAVALNDFSLIDAVGVEALSDLMESIGSLGPAMDILKNIPAETIKTTLNAIGEAMVSFADALDKTPFWGPSKRGKGIALLMENVDKLAIAISTLSGMSNDDIGVALAIVRNALMGFGDALNSAPFWFPKTRASGINALVDSLGTLFSVLPQLDAGDALKFTSAMGTAAYGFQAFGEALKRAPILFAKDKAEGVGILVESLTTLYDGIKKFMGISEEDAVSFKDSLALIANAFYSLGVSLQSAPFWAEDKGEGISLLVNSIDVLKEGVEGFMDISDAEGFQDTVTLIGETFKDFGRALQECPLWAKSGSEAVVNLVNSVSALVDPVYQFSELDADTFSNVMTNIGGAFKDFGEAIKSTPFWNASGKGDAIVKVVGSLTDLAPVITEIAGMGTKRVETAIDNLTSGLKKIAEALSVFDSTKATEIERLDTATGTLKKFAKEAKTLDTAVSANLPDRISKFGESLGKIGSSISEKMSSGVDATKGAGKSLIAKVKDLCTKIIAKIKEVLKSDKLKNLGKNVSTGIANGILNGKSEVIKASNTTATAAINAFKKKLKINSPSKEGEEIGKFLNKGFATGLIESTRNVTEASETVGEKALDSLRQAIAYISQHIDDDMDTDPVITPVLDLSNIDEGASEISRLLGNSRSFKMAASSNAIMAAAKQAQYANSASTMSNSDVVDAINKLRSDVDVMSAKMGNMQVVMDSGALVGQLTSPLDSALGVRYNRNRREKG